MNIGDEVTVCGTIIGITPSGNPFIKIGSSGRVLIKAEDVKTICPKINPPEKDMRRGS
jgi:hypothetical protein